MYNSYKGMAHIPIRQHINVENETQNSEHKYLYDLQMYIIPPSGDINLEELQQWCIDRFRVLKLVERISAQNYKKSSKHCFAILIRELENCENNFGKILKASSHQYEEKTKWKLRRNDCASHFILRSAFSFEYEKRLWFFKQEVKLFKWRLFCLSMEDIKAFCNVNEFEFLLITKGEKERIAKHFESSCFVNMNADNMNLYKVHFCSVINLVAKRQVFLYNGNAYLPDTKLFWFIINKFKRKLNDGFSYSRLIASNAYNDERITNMFTTIPNYITKQCFTYHSLRHISLNELDELSERSYPLCMKLLHEALRKNHHLTNGGRVQYCLFLKGIGLSLNDVLQFWKSEFTKKINEFTFEKEYKYAVRHLYGQEGRRANYEPFHCSKIQNSIVSSRDNHGCPFKHMSSDVLKLALFKCNLVQSDVESVLNLSRDGSFLKACKKYYEIKHNCITDKTFDHPNVYFNCSCARFENANSGNFYFNIIVVKHYNVRQIVSLFLISKLKLLKTCSHYFSQSF